MGAEHSRMVSHTVCSVSTWRNSRASESGISGTRTAICAKLGSAFNCFISRIFIRIEHGSTRRRVGGGEHKASQVRQRGAEFERLSLPRLEVSETGR